jgi:hypothetical protein
MSAKDEFSISHHHHHHHHHAAASWNCNSVEQPIAKKINKNKEKRINNHTT